MIETRESIVLIGPIAPPQWGPAVRNRIMLDTLTDWGIEVQVLNTLEWKKHPISFLCKVVKNAFHTERFIVSVSQNGRRALLPLLAFLSLLRPIKIVFIPAGGLVGNEIASMPMYFRRFFIACCRRCTTIAVQRHGIEHQLHALGIHNTTLLTNFKRKPIHQVVKTVVAGPVRILFLSRVRPLKGIETLFSALDMLAAKKLEFIFDVYGIVDDEYQQTLNKWLATRPYATYRGILEYDKVIKHIISYDLMVFPTLCDTEGFPGVLADAALAGLAVVASDVSCNLELIIPGYNGLLAKAGDAQDLADKVESLIHDPFQRQKMADNNRIIGHKYDADYVLRKFWDDLTARGW